jgi:sec-independent protein translocase protein TatA
MGALSPVHILILLVIVVLIFGASRLPKLGRSMGEGIRGFKEGLTGDEEKQVDAPVATQIEASDQDKPTV